MTVTIAPLGMIVIKQEAGKMTRKKAKADKYEIIDVDGDRRDFEGSDGCTAYDFDTYEAALKAVNEYETTETAYLPWTTAN